MAILIGDNFKFSGIRLVVFDRDGTLIDLYAYWSGMIGLRSDIICQKFNLEDKNKKDLMYTMGVDVDNGRLRPEGPVGLKKREIVMQAAVDYLKTIGVDDGERICLDSFNKADGLSLAKMEIFIKPLKDLTSLLNKLKKYGCMIGIATTDKSDRARMTMEKLNLIDYFDIILGTDNVASPKPAPDMLNLALNKLGVGRDEAVMVGDAITDIQMGINAGVKAIGVCSGLASKEDLCKLTSYVIPDISYLDIYAEKVN